MPDIELKQRIIQELVPGKQITLAHIIASPDRMLYESLGISDAPKDSKAAIGIMTITPAETAIIIADIAIKSSGVRIISIDKNNGSLIVTGSFSEVEASINAILTYLGEKLNFSTCELTKT